MSCVGGLQCTGVKTEFKDHFSGVASAYAAARPTYPQALFDWLASVTPDREMAVDCACGNGQATLDLAARFRQVIGVEASESQIRSAPGHSNIEWRVARAEHTGLADHRASLVVVAQAAHWFDLDAFYAEVRRLLKPGGVVALWCYGLNSVDDPVLTAAVQDFYSRVVGPYWPPERRHVESGYQTLNFPFEPLSAPPFEMSTSWSLPEFLAYVATWSAVSRYRAERGRDPIPDLERTLSAPWGGPERRRRIVWPLSVLAGCVLGRQPAEESAD